MMRKLPFAIYIVVLVLTFGCDTNQGSFDETIPNLYTLTTNVLPEESGTVHPSGGEFVSGDEIEIEARPAEGFVFERWEDDLTGNTNPDLLIFNANRNITAHFVPRDYELNIEILGEGFVRETVIDRSSAEGSSGSSSTTVRLTAEPEDGWFFDRWEGDLTGSSNPETITVDEEKSVTAVFDQEDTDGYTITINIEGEGSVDKNPDRNFYNEGSEVTLTAIASSGWIFVEWQGDLSGSENSQTVAMEQHIVTTAFFELSEDPTIEIIQQPSKTIAGNPVSPAPEVKLTDNRGDPIEDAEINVTLNNNSFTSGSSTSVITNGEGIAVFDNLIIEAIHSGYILTFETDEPGVSDVSSTLFEVVAADVDASNSSAQVPDGVTGEETVIRITLKDRFDNPVTGAADKISAEVSGANNTSPSINETGTSGEYTASYTPLIAGTDHVDIQVNGTSIDGSPFESNVEAADASTSNSTVTVEPSVVKVGEYSIVSVELRDHNGNPIGGLNDSDFDINLTGNASAGTVNETSTAGTYQFEVTNNTVEEVTVTVTANGATLNDTPIITFETGEPHEIVILIQPQNTRSGQPIRGPPTVQVKDEFGHEISGVDVSVREEEGQEFSSGDLVVTTDGSGIAEFNNLVINSRVGLFTLVFSATGVEDVASDLFLVSIISSNEDED